MIRPPRIAVVDDEADVATYVCCALVDSGFEAVGITEPELALDQMRAFRPDLVCLDLVMPGRTGVSLYLDLKADPLLLSVPVLILSGIDAHEELEDAVAARHVPAPAGYLEKPLDIAAVVDVVRNVVAAGSATNSP